MSKEPVQKIFHFKNGSILSGFFFFGENFLSGDDMGLLLLNNRRTYRLNLSS